MRNKGVKILAGLVVGFVMAQVASALPVTFYRVSGYYMADGGEFTLVGTPYADNYAAAATVAIGNDVGFQTFCLERNEYVSVPGTYYYDGLDSAAVQGGVGGGNPDPISWGTAWLYSQFAQGSLAGYDYTPGSGRSGSAGMLQTAIWYLEQEITLANPGGNSFLAAVITQFGSLVDAGSAAAAGAYGVHVINPVDQYGAYSQSQLVYTRVADGGVTLIMLGAGIAVCAALRRKFAASI